MVFGQGHENCVRTLLLTGADKDGRRGLDGATPLHQVPYRDACPPPPFPPEQVETGCGGAPACVRVYVSVRGWVCFVYHRFPWRDLLLPAFASSCDLCVYVCCVSVCTCDVRVRMHECVPVVQSPVLSLEGSISCPSRVRSDARPLSCVCMSACLGVRVLGGRQAAFFGQMGAVRELLDSTANPNMQDAEGCTPVFLAAQEGHEEVCMHVLYVP